MKEVMSKNNVPVRLENERWLHITESHCEMAGYCSKVLECVENPDVIYEGTCGELLALREIEKDKYVVVVYKEVSRKDGFVITSFLTTKKKQFEKRRILWSK